MFVKIASILLISVVLFKPVMGVYMVIDYELNKDYISKYLCENKDRSELKCEGKCYLMKKLRKSAAESEEHKAKQLSQISKIEIMVLTQLVNFAFSNNFLLKVYPCFTDGVNSGFQKGIFKPPIL